MDEPGSETESLVIVIDLDVLLWSEYDDGCDGAPIPSPSFSFPNPSAPGGSGDAAAPAAAAHHCWVRPGLRRFLLQMQLLQQHLVPVLVSRCSCAGPAGNEPTRAGADCCCACACGGMDAALRAIDPDGQCFGGRALCIQPGSARRLSSPGGCRLSSAGVASDGYSDPLCLLRCGEDPQPPPGAAAVLVLPSPDDLPAALCRHPSQLAVVTSSRRAAYGTLGPGVIEVQPYCREYGPYDDLLDTLAAALVARLAPAAADAALYGVPDTLRRLGLSAAPLAASPLMQALCAQALMRAAAPPPPLAHAQDQQQQLAGAGAGAGAARALQAPPLLLGEPQPNQQPALRILTMPAAAGGGGGGGGGGGAITSVERLSGASRRALSPAASLPPIPELPSQEVDEQQLLRYAPSTPAAATPHPPRCYTPSSAAPSPRAQRSSGHGHHELPARASPVGSAIAAAAAAAAAGADRGSPPLPKPARRRKGWGALSFATARVAAEGGGGGGVTAGDLAAAAACLKQLECQPPQPAYSRSTSTAAAGDLRGSDGLGWRPRSFPSGLPYLSRYLSLSGRSRAAAGGSRGSSGGGAPCSYDDGGGGPARQCSALEAARPPSPLTAAASAVAAATSRLLSKLLGTGGRLRRCRSQQPPPTDVGGGDGCCVAPQTPAAAPAPRWPAPLLHSLAHAQAAGAQPACGAPPGPSPPAPTAAHGAGRPVAGPSATSAHDVELLWPQLAPSASSSQHTASSAAAPEPLACAAAAADRASPGRGHRAQLGHVAAFSAPTANCPAVAAPAAATDSLCVGAPGGAGADAQLADEALRLAGRLDLLLTLHADDPGRAMRLTRPLYRQAMAAARGVRRAPLRAAVREAVRRHVDPRRGCVQEAMAGVWALAGVFTACQGAEDAMGGLGAAAAGAAAGGSPALPYAAAAGAVMGA